MAGDFLGYVRPDGSVGTRNLVAVISAMDNSNPVARMIAAAVRDTVVITPHFVRGQYGDDLKIALDTLGGIGRNPNVAAVLLVGLEERSVEALAERIRPTGKPIDAITLQPIGTIEAVAEGTRRAVKLALAASAERRQRCPVASLVVGLECGGSDTTSGLSCNPAIGRAVDRLIDEGGTAIISETSEFFGAEQLFAARASDRTVRDAFAGAVARLEREAIERGMDIRGTNPTPDNIRGGLTTIEEKALGALAKAGSRPLTGVLKYGEPPAGKGLYFMDAPAAAVENLTALAAGGCNLVLFGTGVGNPIGTVVSPTIKVSGNINTLRTMGDNIDFDASAILEAGAKVSVVGDRLYGHTLDVASGSRTRSELLDINETAISRFAPSI